jgi:hypothetical protein
VIDALNHSQFRPNNFKGRTALVARFIEGETALVFVQDDFLMGRCLARRPEVLRRGKWPKRTVSTTFPRNWAISSGS